MNLEKAFAMIREYEGLELRAYRDSGGLPTIGYGTIMVNGQHVHMGMTCTQAQAEAWMEEEARRCAHEIQSWLRRPATDNEISALVSLSYNIGMAGLKHSHLLADFNAARPIQVVAHGFLSWCHVKGQFNQGLYNRRQKEAAIFLSA